MIGKYFDKLNKILQSQICDLESTYIKGKKREIGFTKNRCLRVQMCHRSASHQNAQNIISFELLQFLAYINNNI